MPRRHGLTTRAAKAAKARTATAKARPAGRRFWTVQAGDTFGVISSKSGVPVKTIVRLNPKVTSTSLHIGERIQLR
ncbi:MAG: LysM peptidoglycan-binding domain-containing protein [Actinomycetota bacterium]|nr:LysM peptidoglycan-binding domain-containing protein [Actinomycetota bacterium]